MRLKVLAGAAAAGSLLAACSATPGVRGTLPAGRSAGGASAAAGRPAAAAPAGTAGPTATAAPASTTTAPTTTVPPTTVAPITGTAVAGGWTVVGQDGPAPAVEQQTVTSPDGTPVVLLRFVAGHTVFDLHVGSNDPPTGGAAVPPSGGPAVSAAQRPLLLGAFNGGFQVSSGSGGFQVDGVVLRPLRAGLASLVIDNGGRARVAVWGADPAGGGAPAAGESVASVRQNLPPLVSGGRPASDINIVSDWGATLHGAAFVARSAVGTDPAGNLVFAGSRSAVPRDLSAALIDAGCVTAMELDINPEWVQADVAATPGAPLSAAIPGQSRPAAQYIDGWTRDFVTVQAAS